MMKKVYTQPVVAENQIQLQRMLCGSVAPIVQTTTILNEAGSFAGAAPKRVGGAYI